MAKQGANKCNEYSAGHHAHNALFSGDDKKYEGQSVQVAYIEGNRLDITIDGAARAAYHHDVAGLAGKFVEYPKVSVSKEIDGGLVLRLSRNHRSNEGWPKSTLVSMSWTPVKD